MAGSATRSFTSPGGAPPKMKTGHMLPKYKQHGKRDGGPQDLANPVDPLQHASSRLPNFQTRHRNTNSKSGFNTKPAHPPAGRLAQRPGSPNRGSGKVHRAKG
jgi:hypothetical protein